MNKLYLLIVASIFFACNEHNNEKSKQNVVPEKSVAVKAIDTQKFEPILGNFSKPIANHSNTSIALSNTEGDRLFVYSGHKKREPKLIYNTINAGNNFTWDKDDIHVVFKEKTKDYKTKIIKLNTITLAQEELVNLPIHTALNALKISDTIYYLDQKTLAVKAKFNNTEWTISTEKGNYYNIEVSPDNKYIIAHKGSFIYLFTTAGKFIKKLGKGIATSWHSNSKHIIGFIDISDDGHHTSGSELYLYHVIDDPVQITHSDKAIETWPSFKNDSEVLYRDELRNGVFSVDIKQFIK